MNRKQRDNKPPQPDEPPSPRPGTRMLEIQPPAAPYRLPEEQVEQMRREEAERTEKRKKRKKGSGRKSQGTV